MPKPAVPNPAKSNKSEKVIMNSLDKIRKNLKSRKPSGPNPATWRSRKPSGPNPAKSRKSSGPKSPNTARPVLNVTTPTRNRSLLKHLYSLNSNRKTVNSMNREEGTLYFKNALNAEMSHKGFQKVKVIKVGDKGTYFVRDGPSVKVEVTNVIGSRYYFKKTAGTKDVIVASQYNRGFRWEFYKPKQSGGTRKCN